MLHEGKNAQKLLNLANQHISKLYKQAFLPVAVLFRHKEKGEN